MYVLEKEGVKIYISVIEKKFIFGGHITKFELPLDQTARSNNLTCSASMEEIFVCLPAEFLFKSLLSSPSRNVNVH